MPIVNPKHACPKCGEPSKGSNYCRPCLAAYKRAQRRKRAEDNPIECVECGTPFVRVHGSSKTCSKECSYALSRHTLGAWVREPRACVWCGEEFMPLRYTIETCSRRCFDLRRQLIRRDDPIYRTQHNERGRQFRRENHDAVLARSRLWRANNLERARELGRAWWEKSGYTIVEVWDENTGENIAVRHSKRSLKILSLTRVPIHTADVRAKMAYWGNKCWMCGGPFEAVDHVKPIAKNGLNVLANLRPACTSCNSSKRDKWYGVASLSMFIRQ